MNIFLKEESIGNNDSFSLDIDKVLNNIYPKNQQVKVRIDTPKILLSKDVKNLPILIIQKHIKSIIYTLEEAKKLGLPTKNINYHGLGKELLLKVINSIDNPVAVYKKDANNYIIITEFKDYKDRPIIIPIQTNGIGRYNNEFIYENQIKSVYGRNNLNYYLKNNKFDKVYTKKKN